MSLGSFTGQFGEYNSKGISKTVQNDVLDCMLAVLEDDITKYVKSADFLSFQADETMAFSTQCQLLLVLCYIDNHNVYTRVLLSLYLCRRLQLTLLPRLFWKDAALLSLMIRGASSFARHKME